jgi:hypothetical protein
MALFLVETKYIAREVSMSQDADDESAAIFVCRLIFLQRIFQASPRPTRRLCLFFALDLRQMCTDNGLREVAPAISSSLSAAVHERNSPLGTM